MQADPSTPKSKIFYGWVVLFCLLVMYAVSNGIGVNTMPLFNPHIAQSFDMDIASISKLVGMFWILLALPLPFIGQLLDRVSARKVIYIGAFGLAACMLLLGQIKSYTLLATFYIAYPLCLSLCGLLSSMYILNQWFSKYRGLAIGIFLMSSSLGGAVFPKLAGNWIEAFGWQQAALYLGVVGAICILVPLFFIRNKPADLGAWPDGIEGTIVLAPRKDAFAARLGLKQALKTPRLYLLITTTAMLWFVIIGFQANQGFFLQDLKLDAARSGTIFSLFFICSVAGKLLFGWLGDRFDKKFIMLVSIINVLAGVILLKLSMQSLSLLPLAAVVLGVGFAGTFTMIQLFVAYLYMGPSYGSILGMVSFADTLASAGGAIVIANLRQRTESFEQPFNLLIALSIIALIATLLIRKRKTRVYKQENIILPTP